MFLFGKKREKNVPVHTEYAPEQAGSAALREAERFVAEHQNGIKVLGADSALCAALKEVVDEVLVQLSLSERIEYIDDVYKIAAYGIMHTPALVIDGKIVCTGWVPSKKEIASFLKKRR